MLSDATIQTALGALRWMKDDSRNIRLMTTGHHHKEIMERIDAAITELKQAAGMEVVPIVLEPHSVECMAMAGLLADVMSDLSETAYFAGWMDGCEYGIWQELQGINRGWFIRDQLAVDQLTLLSGMIDGWIIWDDEEGETRYCPMSEWLPLYQSWQLTRPKE